MKLESGAQITPNVRLLRPLGEGGMGAVWIAEHRALGTEVAVKFLARDLLSNETMRARFASEASAASQVKSSHVVKIYDHGLTDTEMPFIVMELLDGEDLSTRMHREGRLAPALVATITTQLCKALQAAHDKSVIHRDVKPENVFLTSEDGDVFVKLLDFGVAKNDRVSDMTLKRSTMAGEALGTPYYMSPEQYRSSKGIDRRADLWSVGVVVYEALTGSVPFDAENLTSLAIVVNEAKAKPPSEVEPSLPKAFDAWFAKACARDPDARFGSARELADALRVALGLDSSPRTSLPDTSDAHRVVIATGDSEKDLSLQKTAFASTGSAKSSAMKRSRWPAVAGIGAVLGIAAIIVVVAAKQSHEAPAPSSTPPPPKETSVVVTDKPLPSPAIATTSAPVASVVPIEALPKATSTAKSEVKKRPAESAAETTSAQPATTASTRHDQIW